MLIELFKHTQTHTGLRARLQKQSQAFPSGESHKHTHARSLIPNAAPWDRFSQRIKKQVSLPKGELE